MNFKYIRNVIFREHTLQEQFNQDPQETTIELLILNQMPESIHAEASGFVAFFD